MSMARNIRRLQKRALKKGQEMPIPNYHVEHKKSRKYSNGTLYNNHGEKTFFMNKSDKNE